MSALVRTEFRCSSKVHGVKKVYPNGKTFLEVRCKDRKCADRGVGEVVFHYFNFETGQLDYTQKYRDPFRAGSSVTHQTKGDDK